MFFPLLELIVLNGVGYEGAPVTQSLTIYSPLFNQKLGVGLTLLNDKIGPTNTTNIYGDIAYRLKVSKKSTLSFGLKGGISLVQGSFNDLVYNMTILTLRFNKTLATR